jgi:geranylgeranyl pyrophosphate synthase
MSPSSPFAEATDAPEIADLVRSSLDELVPSGRFRELLDRILERPGRVLAPGGGARWPLFVLGTARAFGGAERAARGVAAAFELMIATTDVIDDLVDGDWDPAVARPERATVATLALGWLSQHAVGRLVAEVGAERASLLGRILARGVVSACVGEDLDIGFEDVAALSEDDAHEMTLLKSGSLVGMACELGAAVATDDPDVLETVRAFGTRVGIILQLQNDLAGVDPANVGRSSDLIRKKKTLPIAYSLRCAREEGIESVLAWYEGRVPPTPEREAHLARTVRELGADQFTWVVADAHRHEALALLESLACSTDRPEVADLSRLVPSLRAEGSERRPA